MVLLVAVVAIWGTLTYKVYNHFAGKNYNPIYPVVNHINKSKLISPKIYIIHSYSRDPFLSILTDTAQPVASLTAWPKIAVISKKPTVLPEYMGFFEDGKKKTAIIKYERKTTFIHEGDKWQKLSIVRITTDSLIVTDEGKRQAIKMKKRR